VTEQEWNTSDDLREMLEYLTRGNASPKVAGGQGWHTSDRKLRLFACACCRAAPPKDDNWGRFLEAVRQMEKASDVEPYMPTSLVSVYFHPEWDANTMAQWASQGVPNAAAILRDVIGNPFRPVVVMMTKAENFARSHGHIAFEWVTPTLLSITQAAYDERLPNGTLDPHRLLVLADALEEVGCTTNLLAHLRSPDPHWRGCFVVDALLRKE
jgi:hypothetical protein